MAAWRPRGAWVLWAAALALLALAAINELAFSRSSQALASLTESGTARSQINFLLRRVIDAETGQRGYLLSGRREYLEPYETAAADVRGALDWLGRYYGADQRARALVGEIVRGVNAKLDETALTLRMYEQGNAAGWREMLLTDIGREKMEGVRAATEQLLALETERVNQERAEIARALRLGRLGIDAMLVLVLVALWLYARQAAQIEAARREHARSLAAERDRLEDEVRTRTAELSQLARHLQDTREDERSRLARELHDELGALLTAAKLDAARLKRGLAPMSPEVAERFGHLVGAIDQGVALKRRIIEDLRPSSLEHLGLVAALEILAREFAARAELEVQTRLDAVTLAPSAQITVYRLVQECFTNIAKHSAARRVELSLKTTDDQAQVCVSDDGHGFDAAALRAGVHGLAGMRHRVESEGGRLAIDAAPGRGVRVNAWLPLLSAQTAV
jgi:signal transduction histidine kinase